MPITRQSRRNRSVQPSLFLRPPNRPIWNQFPEQNRQEAQRLIAQMFIAQITRGQDLPADEEAGHE